MANTTNYNWETPDDTDLVKDGAAAIRTLGNSIDTTTKNLNPETTTGDIAYRSATANTNTRLAIGSTGQVLTVAAGVPSWATPTVGDITEVQAGVGISVASGTGPIPVITNSSTDLITTAGDLLYGTAADTVARLGIGTAGQVLAVNSGANAPEWIAAPGSGKVLQVVTATHSTAVTIASTSFTDTGLTATITPSAATSKILILAQQSMFVERDTNQAGGALQLVRAATNILTTDAEHPYLAATGASYTSLIGYQTITYLDSPSTTSATAYKIQMRAASTSNNGKAIAQRQSTPSSIVLLEIGA